MICKHYGEYFHWDNFKTGESGCIIDVCIKDIKHPKVCDHTRCQESCPEFEDERR